MKPKLIILFGLLACAFLSLGARQPHTEWVDPSTGHRVVQLSRQPGSSSSYFTQNEFTPSARWMVFRSNMDGVTRVYDVEVASAQ